MKLILLIVTSSLFFFSCNSKSSGTSSTMELKKKDSKQLGLKTKIEEGLDKEQALRDKVNQNSKRDTFDSKLNSQIGIVDSLNLINVLEYLNNHGYPSISKDGKKLCDAVFYILQHNDVKYMEKYVGELKEKAFAGEASKTHYALMIDRVLMENNKKQIYGSQAAPRKNSKGYVTNDYFIWPIKNPSIVDSLRKDIGLTTTIEEYARAIYSEYEPNEPLPKK